MKLNAPVTGVDREDGAAARDRGLVSGRRRSGSCDHPDHPRYSTYSPQLVRGLPRDVLTGALLDDYLP